MAGALLAPSVGVNSDLALLSDFYQSLNHHSSSQEHELGGRSVQRTTSRKNRREQLDKLLTADEQRSPAVRLEITVTIT